MKIEIIKPYNRRTWVVQTEYGIAGEIRLYKKCGWHFDCNIRSWGFSCPTDQHHLVYAAAKEKITILNILRRLTS